MLLDQERNRSIEHASVACVLDVEPYHLRQKRRLRAIQVVDPATVRHKPEPLDEVKKVLNGVLGDIEKAASSTQQSFQNPYVTLANTVWRPRSEMAPRTVAVPIVCFSETTSSDNECTV